ncbi:uncharacterized protein LOC129720254 [Wyeomyia smithii]|uniref:uncharacterized protein LOC129720254 n=1 Tax=Wyeomyia smithii TaxID=174621 RepID=UPI002467EB4F|nr:uncharacterized protein LOC129720254 [Wyeomyia smithii]
MMSANFEELFYNVSNAVEELFLEAKTRIATQTPSVSPTGPQVIIQQQPLKAPIPSFDGSYDSWPKFKAIFQDLMANSGDTDAIKLYHLDKALTGDAAGVLDAKIPSEGNYQQAWEILSDRYENKRVLVETHIRGLLNLKKMTSESHKELRGIITEANRHVESLRYLQQEITGVSEHIIVYLLISALDKATRKSWEATQKKGELPNYKQVNEFLKSRCQILENCEAAFQTAPPIFKSKQQPTKVLPQKSHTVSAMASTPPVPAASNQPSTSKQKIPAIIEPPVSTTCSSNLAQATKTVLLLTAVDSGSQVNFVTEDMANRLGLPKKHANVPIVGINALRSHARDKITLKFKSRVSNFQASLECLITPKVTGTIPVSKINTTHWNLPEGVVLADPGLNTPQKVDLLVGAELFFDILKPSQLSLDDNLPQLRDTHLGWIASGVIVEPQMSNISVQHVNHTSLEDIERMMQQFWKIEEVSDVPKLSTEKMACETHFLSTYQRDEGGRFIVRLPFNENASKLGDCRALALKRFLIQEKRLMNNPELQAQYVEFIQEYEALGHCREIFEANDPPNQQKYYLPHHAVLRPSSSSRKFRGVFNASAKSSSEQLSLNEVFQVGPVVQNDLHFIILRFRKLKIAFSGDIAKMYRQVLHAPQDRRFLRIFWRAHPSQPLRVLELCTVTYGTASAPYLATRCLVQLVEEEGEFFPFAARIVKEETYMDDVLSGAGSIEEAIEAQRQLQQLLGSGGFPIRKWCSNSPEFLEHIPIEDQEKRVPLAERLISPVIVLAKLLVQRLWQLKIGWDDLVDEDTARQWNELQVSMSLLTHIAIPRCVTFEGAIAHELHGFSDASTVAYGACNYLRSLFADGSAKLRLLTSKPKVAPLEELSIPRKELRAARILTRLLVKVIPALDMELREIVLWCDSTIVLAWIKKPLNQLQLYSSFRKIQRVMSYVLRFIANCRIKVPTSRDKNPHQTISELRSATEAIIRVVQQVHLADEIHRVINNEP